jgi:hypothetical protein
MSGEPSPQTVGYALLAMGFSASLADALVEIGKVKGIEDLAWLDAIEAKFFQDLKNSHAEGTSESFEADAVTKALEEATRLWSTIRAEVISEAG